MQDGHLKARSCRERCFLQALPQRLDELAPRIHTAAQEEQSYSCPPCQGNASARSVAQFAGDGGECRDAIGFYVRAVFGLKQCHSLWC